MVYSLVYKNLKKPVYKNVKKLTLRSINKIYKRGQGLWWGKSMLSPPITIRCILGWNGILTKPLAS